MSMKYSRSSFPCASSSLLIRYNINCIKWALPQKDCPFLEAVVLLLLIYYLLLLPFLVGVLCLVVVLLIRTLCPSYWWGGESWLLYFNCIPDVLWQSVFCGSTSLCHGLVCSEWLWYFLIILTSFLGLVSRKCSNQASRFLISKRCAKNWLLADKTYIHKQPIIAL